MHRDHRSNPIATPLVPDQGDVTGESEVNLSPEQKDAFLKLRSQRNEKFAEIVALLAKERGVDDPAALEPRVRQGIFDDATAAIIRWMEQAEMDRKEPSTAAPPTLLQRLLNQHYELGEQQVDILDEARERDDTLSIANRE
jgi:hypothetical protein